METFLIAEACDNHLGSLETAKKLAEKSKIAGATAVKFQHHLPDEEMLKDVPNSSNFNIPLYEFLKKYALSLDEHFELKEFCDSIKIEYMCTPFSLKAAIEINPLVKRFKIGSGEFTDIPSLIEIAKFKKQMILSTGMSTLEEIEMVYSKLRSCTDELCFLNCVSEYPPIYEDINLKVIPLLIKKYPDIIVGHSDHTPSIETSLAAITLGAKIIEKHVTLDKNIPCPDQSVSIDFNEFELLSKYISNIEKALGGKKDVHEKEVEIRLWARRSLVTIKDIKKGEILSKNNMWSKRPGTGIPSYLMDEYMGKEALIDIPKNTIIDEKMLIN